MSSTITIETPGLGDRSYLVHDGEVAIVIDPQRDIDRVTAIVDRLGVRVTHVLETHLHNDYVTGGLALARRTGAEYVVAAADAVAFERRPVADGDVITTGRLSVTAVHTPGHTPNHMSYALSDAGEVVAVFTGGSMLFGAVGRTDLISEDRTEELTRAQYRSVRRLAAQFPDGAEVLPTHGFGSFCSATETTGDSSTIGQERRQNIALTVEDEDRFVEQLMAGLVAYPSYYVHMGPLNAAGPAAPDLSPPRAVDAGELRERIDAGEWIVDLRQRRAYARDHLAGTVSIELGDPFATFFGWTLPWDAPATLVGGSPEQVLEARRQLARIGIDRVAGAAVDGTGATGGLARSAYPVVDFAELAGVFGSERIAVLDVRRHDEWDAGHLTGAVHIPFWELAERVDELPDREIWVHCQSGMRASIGASIVDRSGRPVVCVDDQWPPAAELGLPIEMPS